MDTKRTATLGTALCLFLLLPSACGETHARTRRPAPGAGAPDETPSIEARGAAATVRVLGIGHVDVEHPFSASLRMTAVYGDPSPAHPWGSLLTQRAILEQEWERDRRAGSVPAGTDYAEYAWQRIAADPSRCLDFTARTAARFEDRRLGEHAGVLVAADGVVLTSAAAVHPSEGLDDAALRAAVLQPVVRRIVEHVSSLVRGGPPARLHARLDHALVAWVASAADTRPELCRLLVQLPHGPRGELWPARVVCDAGEAVVRDVAVLKVEVPYALPAIELGDDLRVRAGEVVHCLANGRWTLGRLGPCADAHACRELTVGADRPGDPAVTVDGGPVLDGRGRLVALCVAAPLQSAGQCVAVPVVDALAAAGLAPKRRPAERQLAAR